MLRKGVSEFEARQNPNDTISESGNVSILARIGASCVSTIDPLNQLSATKTKSNIWRLSNNVMAQANKLGNDAVRNSAFDGDFQTGNIPPTRRIGGSLPEAHH
jgi:hypothetical protein